MNRELLQRALDALNYEYPMANSHNKAAEILRAALAAPVAPAIPLEVQRDAERYRWLRDSSDSGRMLRMMYGTVPLDDCDAMIDAAMTATKVMP
jgi:hypothetical protein